MKAIYTIYFEVNRKCFDRKIGDTVTKRRIFSTFEDALKYARRYTKTTKNINYVDTVVFENIYELTFEPTEVEAEIFTPVNIKYPIFINYFWIYFINIWSSYIIYFFYK